MIVSAPSCGFDAQGDWTDTTVFLNGVRQDCVYADDVADEIVRMIIDQKGLLVYDVFGDIALEMVSGTVTLIRRLS